VQAIDPPREVTAIVLEPERAAFQKVETRFNLLAVTGILAEER
jgi:hypothetical protein